MLLPYFELLSSKTIILGSQSTSRNLLLKPQLPKYEIVPSSFAEDLDKASFASSKQYNIATCKGKVEDLLNKFQKENIKWDILICCDTILEHEGKVVEKPENKEHCISMMMGLAKKWHKVFSAHQVVFNLEKQLKYEWVVEADVLFGDIPLESVDAYSETPFPYKHSGGYELCGLSGSFIEEVKGSFSSVQGIDTYQVGKYIIEGIKEAKWDVSDKKE